MMISNGFLVSIPAVAADAGGAGIGGVSPWRNVRYFQASEPTGDRAEG
jgi:hypothetical protein